jgi:signal transduction histidine kinase
MRGAVARRLSVLGFALSCAILALIGGGSYLRLTELRDASRAVEHTHEVRTELDRVLSLLTDAETGQRGFLLTGVVSYLEPYKTALASLPARLDRLHRLTDDNPRQQTDLSALESLIQRKAAELNATIAARETRGFDVAARIVLTDEGKRVMDQIRTVIAAMGAEEQRLLTERTQREERASRTAVFTTIGGLALALLLGIAATLLLNLAIRERTRAETARAKAEAADRAKDEFLAVLSHELRTPLTAIVGWIPMLRRAQLDAAQQERGLEIVERNARGLARMIDDLLDISRIVADKMTLERRPISLVSVISETVESFQHQAKGKGVVIVPRVEPGAGVVSADPQRMQQVLMNLLANALRYTPVGGRVEIHLTTHDGHARIRVQDTGIGIEPELLPHVFERFRQGDARSAGTKGGLGLGLAIVRKIVELHGGTVEAESAGPGQGASFIITLPAIGDGC